MKFLLENDWKPVLAPVTNSIKYQTLLTKITAAEQTSVIYPPLDQMYRAFILTPFAKTKVVILGQDPYHNQGQADGLAFSVNKGIKLPPSLRNIFQELQADLGIPVSNSGDLTSWATQGVLLLNSILLVREHEPLSFAKAGFEELTDLAISKLSERGQVIFVLWGKTAQDKAKLIDQSRNKIIKAPHPSPLSAYRGFFGSKPFSKINQYLVEYQERPINWQLPKI